MTFGEVIRETRLRKGLPLREVAGAVNITIAYLYDMERGNRLPPNPVRLEALADCLDLSSDYLYFLSGKLPQDLCGIEVSPERVVCAWQSFREKIREESKCQE